MRAIGADDQVVVTDAAVREARLDALAPIGPFGDRDAEAHACALGERRLTENLVQGGARDAIDRRIARCCDVLIGYLRQQLAVGVVNAPTRKAKAEGQAALTQADVRQGAQHVGRLNDTDAVHGPRRIDLDDLSLDTPSFERQGSRQSADATANNENATNLRHGTRHTAGLPRRRRCCTWWQRPRWFCASERSRR